MRISGPATRRVLASLLRVVPDTLRTASPVRLRSPDLPAILLRFAAPFSYTGEDAAELQVPGNAALLDRLLHRAIQTDPDTRLAEPGEFTFRAYTAGKLDLTQAEGVAATIHATSDSQLRAATLLREGQLGRSANRLVDALGNLLALVEAGIDFTDQEDVVPIPSGELGKHLETLHTELLAVLQNSRPWGAIDALPRVVLFGPPSAGKSTLFNALLGRERAVIDPTPGTTRDVIEEPLRLADPAGREVECMLVDIAGLDADAADLLDRHAQQAAQAAINRADLILQVQEFPTAPRFEAFEGKPSIKIITKLDQAPAAPLPEGIHAFISSKTGAGLTSLRELIVKRLGATAVSVSADMLVLQPRHEAGLNTAALHLSSARAILDAHADPHTLPDIELLADAMRAALDALAGLGGRLTPDEVIGRVFAIFCVGK